MLRVGYAAAQRLGLLGVRVDVVGLFEQLLRVGAPSRGFVGGLSKLLDPLFRIAYLGLLGALLVLCLAEERVVLVLVRRGLTWSTSCWHSWVTWVTSSLAR